MKFVMLLLMVHELWQSIANRLVPHEIGQLIGDTLMVLELADILMIYIDLMIFSNQMLTDC